MSSEHFFIDASLLLESLLQGRKHTEVARTYLAKNPTVISPLSAHLFVYFGQKDGFGLELLGDLLKKYTFTSFGTTELLWALDNCQGTDFEDALQVACAIHHGCTAFATLDTKMAKQYEKFITIKVVR